MYSKEDIRKQTKKEARNSMDYFNMGVLSFDSNLRQIIEARIKELEKEKTIHFSVLMSDMNSDLIKIAKDDYNIIYGRIAELKKLIK